MGIGEKRHSLLWNSSRNCYQIATEFGSGTFLPTILVFSLFLIPLFFYFTNTAGNRVTITFGFPDVKKYESNEYDLKMYVNNDTDKQILFSNLRAIEISMNSRLYSPYDGINACRNAHLVDVINFDDNAGTPNGPNKLMRDGYNMTLLNAKYVHIDGSAVNQNSFRVEPHGGVQVVIGFKALNLIEESINTVAVCPNFQIFGGELGRKDVVCPGASEIHFPSLEYRDRRSGLNSEYEHVDVNAPGEWSEIFVKNTKTVTLTQNIRDFYCSF